jgi:hypothetical protein
MPKQFQDKLLNFMVSGHIKVDQMRKQYDLKIKEAKVFAACNEIARLSRPLQSRFRRLHLPTTLEYFPPRSIGAGGSKGTGVFESHEFYRHYHITPYRLVLTFR